MPGPSRGARAALGSRRPRRGCCLGLALLPLLAILAAWAWSALAPPPADAVRQALEPSAELSVATEPWLVFQPGDAPPGVGLILYPGGLVDPRAYAPLARALAEAGYLVVVPPMPLRLAVLAPDTAAEIQAAFPTVERWVVGGHSLGGAMAARFAAENPDAVDGLVLWAAYPPDESDLSTAGIPVISIRGTQDGLTSAEDLRAARDRLPASTRWIEIEGGNHAQFGWYGEQRGDLPASITREAQQAQVAKATLEWLRAGRDAP